MSRNGHDDQPRMNSSLRLMYVGRWYLVLGVVLCYALLLAVATFEGLAVWPEGRRTLRELAGMMGLIPVEHALQGILGVHVREPVVYTTLAAAGVIVFVGLQVVFLHPRRHWHEYLGRESEEDRWSSQVVALLAGLLSVGTVALLVDSESAWRYLGQYRMVLWDGAAGGVWLNMQAPVALLMLGGFWWVWRQGMRRFGRTRDPYWQKVAALFRLFVAGGLLVLVSGQTYTWQLENYTDYRLSDLSFGSYTAMAVGFAVMLWTAMPAAVLVFGAQTYYRWKQRRCLACGYDLRGSIEAGSAQCPECGERIAEQMKRVVAEQ